MASGVATRIATALVTVTLPLGASGQEAARFPIVDAPPGTPGFGGAVRIGSDNDIGEDVRTDLVPLYQYQGDRFFAHGTSVGIHLYRTDHFSLDALRIRFDYPNPSNNPLLEGLEKRKRSIDAGLAAEFRGNRGQLQLTAVTDVMGRHKGNEAAISYRFPFRRYRWSFSPFASVVRDDLVSLQTGKLSNNRSSGLPMLGFGDDSPA